MRRLQGARHLHPEPQYLVERQGTEPADRASSEPCSVVLHHEVRVAAVGFADLKHAHDVRVPGEPTHRALLAHEPFAVLVEFGGQHLHRNGAVQSDLGAPVDDAEAATADLIGVVEPGRAQLRDDGVPTSRCVMNGSLSIAAPCSCANG